MNNIVVTEDDIEEVIGKEKRFPIDFEGGGPFGISARASIAEIKKGKKGEITQGKPYGEIVGGK